MNFAFRLFSAAARIFGPPGPRAALAVDREDRAVGDAGVAAALIALGAKMAKADGRVSREEIDAFRTVFQTTPRGNLAVARFFDLSRQTTLGYRFYARIVARKYRSRPDILEDVLDGLFHIALADGIVTQDEIEFLETVARIFGFSNLVFGRIRAAHIGHAANDPYLILGVDGDVSDRELKLAYRRMAAANHPDRLVARGLPAELQKLATQKMAIINKAYAEVRTRRNQENA